MVCLSLALAVQPNVCISSNLWINHCNRSTNEMIAIVFLNSSETAYLIDEATRRILNFFVSHAHC